MWRSSRSTATHTSSRAGALYTTDVRFMHAESSNARPSGNPLAALHSDFGVQAFPFPHRVGTLPEKREGDSTDYTPLLHRDGSVFSVVYPSDLQQPE